MLVIAYLQRSNISVLEAAEKPYITSETVGFKTLRWFVGRYGCAAPRFAPGAFGAGYSLGRMGNRSIERVRVSIRSERHAKVIQFMGRSPGMAMICRRWEIQTSDISCPQHWESL